LIDTDTDSVLVMLNDHNDHVTSVNFLYIDENILFITTSKDSTSNVY